MMSGTRQLVNSNLSPDSVPPLSVVLLRRKVKQEAPKRQHGAEVYPPLRVHNIALAEIMLRVLAAYYCSGL